jgi:tetratricopeptide (TPR) repeat protein
MERIEKLKQFLELNPRDAFVQHALALEYVKIGEEGLAEQLFSAIIDQDPENTGTYYHLAKLLERLNRREEAIRVYEQGMEACRKTGDSHALRELQNAYEDLLY